MILGADQNGRGFRGREGREWRMRRSLRKNEWLEKNFLLQTHHSKTNAMRNAMTPGMNYNHLARPAKQCHTATLPLLTICIF